MRLGYSLQNAILKPQFEIADREFANELFEQPRKHGFEQEKGVRISSSACFDELKAAAGHDWLIIDCRKRSLVCSSSDLHFTDGVHV